MIIKRDEWPNLPKQVRFLCLQKSLEATFDAAIIFCLLLYPASWKQSDKYYDDGYDKQYPYYGAEVEDEKAKQPK